jgi:hypothetical protein
MTAVEWLIEQLNNYDSKMIELFNKEVEQAKENVPMKIRKETLNYDKKKK